MYKLFVREETSKHPILRAIVNVISDEKYQIFDIRKPSNILSSTVKRGDTLIFSDPLVFLFLVVKFPFTMRCKVRKIFVSLEMFEYQRDNKGILSRLRNFIFKKAHIYALNRTEVIFPNQARADYYSKRYGIKSKISVLPNFPSQDTLNAAEQLLRQTNSLELNVASDITEKIRRIRKANKLIVVYAGSFNGSNRSIRDIIKAFSYSRKAVLLVAGKDQSGIFSNGACYSNVHYLGNLQQSKILEVFALVDCGIAYYSNENMNTKYAAPVKIFEYSLFGLTVICNFNVGVYSQWGSRVRYFEGSNDLLSTLENLKPRFISSKSNSTGSTTSYESGFRKILND